MNRDGVIFLLDEITKPLRTMCLVQMNTDVNDGARIEIQVGLPSKLPSF